MDPTLQNTSLYSKDRVDGMNNSKILRLYLATFNNGLDHQVDVWAPDAPGKFPVIYMLGGMGALFPGSIYHDMFLQ